MDFKLEVVMLGVTDVDRAKAFYVSWGCRLDADFSTEDGLRVVQVTPPGSLCSIIFGNGLSSAPPGSADSLLLVVDDVDKARTELVDHGVEVSEVFHDAGGFFPQAGGIGRAPGPDPAGNSYASFASFADPDGNGFLLQQITQRLPGR